MMQTPAIALRAYLLVDQEKCSRERLRLEKKIATAFF
jgi:hypothetical protein